MELVEQHEVSLDMVRPKSAEVSLALGDQYVLGHVHRGRVIVWEEELEVDSL